MKFRKCGLIYCPNGEHEWEVHSFMTPTPVLIDNDTISSTIGKDVLEELFDNPRSPKKIIDEKGLAQISNKDEIAEVVLKVLRENEQSVADYKAGKDRALGFLVGQAMKVTKGKANPKMLNELFIEELKK